MECMWALSCVVQHRVAMADLQQLRVQEAVDSMVESLERENIWEMQDLMVWCSAGCCEDSQASVQQVHLGIELRQRLWLEPRP
ncbi:Protein FAM136A [Myotis davidii]|uniref:Protein FAM136A n=1 Tax=Myotis davidii TaxID=225400 RepID=L5M9Q4_MYODS|nr:Protein FAM136A [Myotis davidii]